MEFDFSLKRCILKKNDANFTIESFPASRISTVDICDVGLKKHYIKALLEIDVTDARHKIHEKRRLKEAISFTSWLIKCIATTVSENKQLHAVKKGKRKAVIFNDVDISILIEREVQGEKVPLPYVIRNANEKSIATIHDEIKHAQTQTVEDEGNYVLGEKQPPWLMRLYYAMPGFVRKSVWFYISRKPFFAKKLMGTVVVTSIGMMGKVSGWVIPIGIHPLEFAIGSIVKKPGVVDDRIEVREFLFVTAMVDHDVVDGAEAMRGLSRLTQMMERGFGL